VGDVGTVGDVGPVASSRPSRSAQSPHATRPGRRGRDGQDGQDGRASPHDVATLTFGLGELRGVRRLVADLAHEAGLPRRRSDELTVVVNELAANSVDHGGGRGVVRGWVEPGALVIEVCDGGDLGHSPEGRSRGTAQPRIDAERGRGLWIARQLADVLEIRPADDGTGGTVVRVVTRTLGRHRTPGRDHTLS